MKDTIAAISTALGVGAISIVRLSGSDAIEIANNIFDGADLKTKESHTITYGHIIDNKEIIDEVLVSIMKAPKTFTTEDVVEINCHGGIETTQKVLEVVLSNGARLAEPGEFTKRAFLNGRIDLTESEAVMDLIESKSEKSRQLAIAQLNGNLKELINSFRNNLKNLLSSIEVNIDYPEYYDIEIVTRKQIKEQIKSLKEQLNTLIKESKNTKIIKEGIKIAIVGRPNVGKSSILNKLIEQDKAIVTDIAGTTRDIVEGSINLDGIPLHIIDTAGIRITDNIVEQIGVEKSLQTIDEADLVIVVLNNNEELTNEDKEILEKTKDKTRVIVVNKNDLPTRINTKELENYTIIETNTNSYNGIYSLKEEIKRLFNINAIEQQDINMLSNSRQISLAKQALKSLNDAEKGIKEDLEIDLIEIDLKRCFDLLGEITGENYTDEIIDNLFKNFCVGK